MFNTESSQSILITNQVLLDESPAVLIEVITQASEDTVPLELKSKKLTVTVASD